jgi:phospholipid transport system substrate-binding protein
MQAHRKNHALGGILSIVLLFGTITVAEAGAPMEQMRQTVNELIAILADTALSSPDQAKERRAKVQQVLSQRFAYEAMAQQSLGRHWQELTEAQQQAFIPLFSSLLEQVHTQRIEKYGGDKKSIVFKDESLHADGTASVRLEIVDPRDPTSNENMEYRLQKHQDVWRVHDLLMDGSSIITNFRTQFDQIIRQESYADLVRRLERSPTSLDKAN